MFSALVSARQCNWDIDAGTIAVALAGRSSRPTL